MLSTLLLTAVLAAPGESGGEADVSAQKTAEKTFLHSDLGAGAEAGLPRHLIWGLVGIAPEQFGDTEAAFFARYGMIPDPASKDGLPYGMVERKDAVGVPYLTQNCAWCHVGRVAGKVVLGAGNRELRQADLTRDLIQFATDPRFRADLLVRAAKAEANRRGQLWHLTDTLELTVTAEVLRNQQRRGWRSDNTPVGPGLSVPSLILQEQRLGQRPPEALLPVVKYPSLWAAGDRTRFSFGGNLVGPAHRTSAVAELARGRSPRGILRDPEPFEAIARWMRAAPAPRFPFPVDGVLTRKGEAVYATECARCHGTTRQGSYREAVVPLAQVGTDPDRAGAYGAEFATALAALPFEGVRFEATGGYLSPPHDGLWARGPFLHNGSVPSLRWLLAPAAERPRIFYTGAGVPYSQADVGDACQPVEEDGVAACAAPREGLARYDTRQQGRGNGGHEYGTHLPAAEKRALLEYLKTL